jgi:CheY-like chemotaxis protein
MSSAEQRPVLYVEDDPDHADLVLRSLERHPLPGPVLHVHDGQAALDYLMRSVDDPDLRPRLILLDLRLPKVDGFEVLRIVKSDARLRSIPIVVLSTSANERDVERAYQHHANSYLVKPDAFALLDQLLREISSYWLVWNVEPPVGG